MTKYLQNLRKNDKIANIKILEINPIFSGKFQTFTHGSINHEIL